MSKYGSLRKQQQNLFFHPDALKKHCEKGMLVLLNEYRVLQSEIMFCSFSIFFQQYGSTSGESSPVKDGNASKSVLLFTTFDAFFDDDTSLDLFSLGLQKIHSDPNFLHFLEEV